MLFLLSPILSADMDTPRSEKTHIEAKADKISKDDKPFSAETSVAPSIYETGGAEVETEVLDVPPDGGQGWVVLFGCVVYSAAISGWGYVLLSCGSVAELNIPHLLFYTLQRRGFVNAALASMCCKPCEQRSYLLDPACFYPSLYS